MKKFISMPGSQAMELAICLVALTSVVAHSQTYHMKFITKHQNQFHSIDYYNDGDRFRAELKFLWAPGLMTTDTDNLPPDSSDRKRLQEFTLTSVTNGKNPWIVWEYYTLPRNYKLTTIFQPLDTTVDSFSSKLRIEELVKIDGKRKFVKTLGFLQGSAPAVGIMLRRDSV